MLLFTILKYVLRERLEKKNYNRVSVSSQRCVSAQRRMDERKIEKIESFLRHGISEIFIYINEVYVQTNVFVKN